MKFINNSIAIGVSLLFVACANKPPVFQNDISDVVEQYEEDAISIPLVEQEEIIAIPENNLIYLKNQDVADKEYFLNISVKAWSDMNEKWNLDQEEDIFLKVSRINREINLISRATDKDIWNQEDYWAKPEEVLYKGYGDSEDIVLMKFYALKNFIDIENIYVTLLENMEYVLLIYDNENNPLVLRSDSNSINRLSELYSYSFPSLLIGHNKVKNWSNFMAKDLNLVSFDINKIRKLETVMKIIKGESNDSNNASIKDTE